MTFTTLISTIGVSLILVAFLLNIFKLVSTDHKGYLLLNIVGGAFACYGSVLLDSLPFIILEGTWSMVAIIGLLRSYKKTTS